MKIEENETVQIATLTQVHNAMIKGGNNIHFLDFFVSHIENDIEMGAKTVTVLDGDEVIFRYPPERGTIDTPEPGRPNQWGVACGEAIPFFLCQYFL